MKQAVKQVTEAFLDTPEKQKEWEESLFRVVKTWDNYSSYLGDRIISVLVQNVKNNEKPWWDNVFLHQDIKAGDILSVGYGGSLIKTDLDYAQAVSLY